MRFMLTAPSILMVVAACVGCGRTGLDEGYPLPTDVSNDGGQPPAGDGRPPPATVDAAGPTPDATHPSPDAAPAPVGCVGALRCRSGALEECDLGDVWTAAANPSGLCEIPASCATPGSGINDCGPDQEDCCTTIDVPGGTFVRSYDGVSCPGGLHPDRPPALGCYTSPDHPATISGFRLDKYLVTVARFQAFLAFMRSSSWLPPAASGRHSHLNAGRGLTDAGAARGFEPGWSAAWDDDTLLLFPGDNDNTLPRHPINGVTWAQAYAFCIWDGGFLPSEAEWNYAAAGGDEQRVYPWSRPPEDTTVDCRRAAYVQPGDPNACVLSGAYLVGAKSPLGDGRWGHADLAGLRPEWTLDWLRDYVDPCVDCANFQPPVGAAMSRAVRGYAQTGPTAPPRLLTSLRGDDANGWIGFRCAREPLMPPRP